MSKIFLKWFSGMRPRMGDQHLTNQRLAETGYFRAPQRNPETEALGGQVHAVEAENCNLYSGELRPLKAPALAHTFCRPTDDCWRGPPPDDPSIPPVEPPEPPDCIPIAIESQAPVFTTCLEYECDAAQEGAYSAGISHIWPLDDPSPAYSPTYVPYEWRKTRGTLYEMRDINVAGPDTLLWGNWGTGSVITNERFGPNYVGCSPNYVAYDVQAGVGGYSWKLHPHPFGAVGEDPSRRGFFIFNDVDPDFNEIAAAVAYADKSVYPDGTSGTTQNFDQWVRVQRQTVTGTTIMDLSSVYSTTTLTFDDADRVPLDGVPDFNAPMFCAYDIRFTGWSYPDHESLPNYQYLVANFAVTLRINNQSVSYNYEHIVTGGYGAKAAWEGQTVWGPADNLPGYAIVTATQHWAGAGMGHDDNADGTGNWMDAAYADFLRNFTDYVDPDPNCSAVASYYLGDQPIGAVIPLSVTTNADATPPVSYQWYRNGIALPGEVGPVYNLVTTAADTNASYFVVVQNPCGEQISFEWLLGDVGYICLEYACDALNDFLIIGYEGISASNLYLSEAPPLYNPSLIDAVSGADMGIWGTNWFVTTQPGVLATDCGNPGALIGAPRFGSAVSTGSEYVTGAQLNPALNFPNISLGFVSHSSTGWYGTTSQGLFGFRLSSATAGRNDIFISPGAGRTVGGFQDTSIGIYMYNTLAGTHFILNTPIGSIPDYRLGEYDDPHSIMITIKQNGTQVELRVYVDGVLTGEAIRTSTVLASPTPGSYYPWFSFGRGFLSVSSQTSWGGHVSHLAVMPDAVSADWVLAWDEAVNRNKPGYVDPTPGCT